MIRKLFKNNKSQKVNDIDITKLPTHIAIIMDGNGRWAKNKNLPRITGHKAGIEALRDIIQTSSNLGVKFLTLYAFSTENWKRPAEEINSLMELLVIYLRKETSELHKNNVVIKTIGDISKLPQVAVEEIKNATTLTANNTGLTVNIALNYGGRNEIIRGVKNLCEDVINKKITIEEINENSFSNYLYTNNIPDPDLIIRTSGEIRLSNFLLWQVAYSEFWFTDINWPDFNSECLIQAILDYQKRKRRFGGI